MRRVCTTCMGMSGNGAATGMVRTQRSRFQTRWAPPREIPVASVEDHGNTGMRMVFGVHSVDGAFLRIGDPTSASALPQDRLSFSWCRLRSGLGRSRATTGSPTRSVLPPVAAVRVGVQLEEEGSKAPHRPVFWGNPCGADRKLSYSFTKEPPCPTQPAALARNGRTF